MSKYKQILMDELDEKGYRYTDVDPDDEDSRVIKITFSVDKQPGSIDHWVFFDKEDHPTVQFNVTLTQFTEEKREAGIEVCNRINARFRWVRFYLDEKLNLQADMDDTIREDSVLEDVIGDISIMDDIIVKAYPDFMKALWA